MAGKNPLGMALQESVLPGGGPMSGYPSPQMPSKGQMILGIIADGLAGAVGRPAAFGQHLDQLRQNQQDVAKWGLQRQGHLQDFEAEQRIRQQYEKPDIPPMVRDVAAWGAMSPEQRASYKEMHDPDVVVTLPNGQLYAGPRSGLAGAMTGGAPAAPARPVGRLTPMSGGPTPQASGTFPR